jgi:hypothetical protein
VAAGIEGFIAGAFPSRDPTIHIAFKGVVDFLWIQANALNFHHSRRAPLGKDHSEISEARRCANSWNWVGAKVVPPTGIEPVSSA